MPIDKLQDDEQAKEDIRDHERRLEERMAYESTWRDVDERFPDSAGGFNAITPGGIRGQQNYDVTHITANERFAAAGVAITTPAEKDYIKPRFADPELMKIRDVKIWCEQAGQRLYAIRYNWRTGFAVAANEDWDQLGRYGTSPMWVDVWPDGSGLFYRTVHLSECTIDVDFAGMVDTIDRCRTMTVRQLCQQFGYDNMTPKMQRDYDKDKYSVEYEILQIVDPNTERDEEKMDWRRFPVSSRYLALDEKIYLRRSGFHTPPMAVSRHMTSAHEKYGRSPAIKMLPTIGGVNAMKHTTLRAGHKAVDPALLFANDDGVTSLATKPGGLNPGFVDESGRAKVARMPGGEAGIPYAIEMITAEQEEIKSAFLEEFYKILTDPNSRMTTTEVLEVMSKQGILVRPYAARYETEKQNPVSQRELDLAIRYRQLPPFPPEVKEAGAWPQVSYDNMLAAMARAEATGKTLRFIEALTPIAQIDQGAVYDYLDMDALVPGLAEEIGVKPSYIRDQKQVDAIRADRQQQQQQAADAQAIQQTADAYQNIAKGNAMANQGVQ